MRTLSKARKVEAKVEEEREEVKWEKRNGCVCERSRRPSRSLILGRLPWKRAADEQKSAAWESIENGENGERSEVERSEKWRRGKRKRKGGYRCSMKVAQTHNVAQLRRCESENVSNRWSLVFDLLRNCVSQTVKTSTESTQNSGVHCSSAGLDIVRGEKHFHSTSFLTVIHTSQRNNVISTCKSLPILVYPILFSQFQTH